MNPRIHPSARQRAVTPLFAAVLAAVSMAVLVAPAAQAGDGPMKPAKLERIARELSLSTEQKTQVKAILEAEHEKKRALRQDTHDRLRKVLTKEQFAKFEAK